MKLEADGVGLEAVARRPRPVDGRPPLQLPKNFPTPQPWPPVHSRSAPAPEPRRDHTAPWATGRASSDPAARSPSGEEFATPVKIDRLPPHRDGGTLAAKAPALPGSATVSPAIGEGEPQRRGASAAPAALAHTDRHVSYLSFARYSCHPALRSPSKIRSRSAELRKRAKNSSSSLRPAGIVRCISASACCASCRWPS